MDGRGERLGVAAHVDRAVLRVHSRAADSIEQAAGGLGVVVDVEAERLERVDECDVSLAVDL